MSYTAVVSNRYPVIRPNSKKVAQEMHVEASHGARDFLRQSLDGDGPLDSDKGSLKESLYIQSADGGSDFEERRGAAKGAYLGAGGMWEDIIRENFNPQAYSEEHFEERAAGSVDALPDGAFAALGTMLAYGFWWQMGHFNLFTSAYEQRSWFIEPLARWFAGEMEGYFRDFPSRVEAMS